VIGNPYSRRPSHTRRTESRTGYGTGRGEGPGPLTPAGTLWERPDLGREELDAGLGVGRAGQQERCEAEQRPQETSETPWY
jgi:hypothetical protein